MADEFTEAEVKSMFPDETPAPAAPVETPAAETPAPPATPEPTPTPPATPGHNWEKGLMLEQQKRSRLEDQLAAQAKELADMKAQLAKVPPAPPAPDDLEEIVKAVDDDDTYSTDVHGRQAIKKLLNVTRETRTQMAEIAKQTAAASARAEAAEKALAAEQQARAEEARAAQVWKQFEAENPAIKLSEAQQKWTELEAKYGASANAAFETWKEFKSSATPAAAKPAAPAAGPAIAPPSRATAPGSRQPPVEDDGEFTEEQLELINRQIT